MSLGSINLKSPLYSLFPLNKVPVKVGWAKQQINTTETIQTNILPTKKEINWYIIFLLIPN